ncbi:hypothetical protein WOLCODRAFT_143901 [Wolfiporia cocos MD-104 SS10]|uniref:Uncharacterized protein n=1 Tax=Wolfiporia cocos (strain MD-104) TaxID=742152 RepID=A0A2H3K184_WOLCO|nr:hypothetical protein WOLCODRAFT_143901 [Wolfiporia cocos MD-104 SS10]
MTGMHKRAVLALQRSCNARLMSNGAHQPLYPPKVRAFPFALSKDEAINRLAVVMSIRCWGRDFLGSVCARYFPSLGAKPIQPTRIQAVYLPVWIVDALLTAKAEGPNLHKGYRSQRREAYLQGCSMPGFVHEPLSRLSFATAAVEQYDTIRFTEDLLTQRGTDIHCLPYTLTPFSLVEMAKTIRQDQNIGSDIHFVPKSVQEIMIAAYPVLVPIYLAQYEAWTVDPDDRTTITVALEAHQKNGRIIGEDNDKQIGENMLKHQPPDSVPTIFVNFIKRLSPSEFFANPPGNVHSFVPKQEPPVMEHVTIATALQSYLNSVAAKKGALEDYYAKYFLYGENNVDWEDMRIREYSSSDMSNTRNWQILMQLLDMERIRTEDLEDLAQSVSEAEDSKEEEEDESRSLFRHRAEQTRKKSKMLEEMVARSKPEWLKKWERSRRQ